MDRLIPWIEQLNRAYRKRGRQRLWLSALSLIVIFATVSALRHPAFTQEKTAYCGIEEHVHGEECWSREQICGLEESEGHVHDAVCYETLRELSCGLEESEGHVHDAACFGTLRELSCGLEETEGHVHDEACFGEDGALICGLEETEGHTHGEACYTEREILICGLEESEGHTHGEACYTEREALVCGLEESEGHTHGEACYTEREVLVCGLEESEGHTHGEACFEERLICTLQEHEHTLACYSNPDAREEEEDWISLFPALDGSSAENAAAIALSQLGYRESAENYQVLEDGSVKGITRYGQLWGDPYGDWDAMFVSFCLHYADIDRQGFPVCTDSAEWKVLLDSCGLYAAAGTEDFAPQAGDLVFFDTDADGAADHVGLVQSAGEDGFRAVEGDVNDGVALCAYGPGDPAVLGFGVLPDALRRTDGGESEPPQEEEEEKEEEKAETFPAQRFRAELNGMTVEVEADEGAFPENSSMELRAVSSDRVLDAVSRAVEERVLWIEAVDICFYNAGHEEIQPLRPIRVVIRSERIADEDASRTELVCVDGPGAGRLVETTGRKRGENELVFETDEFQVYAVVGTTLEDTVLAGDGSNYRITVSFGPEAGIPAGAGLRVQEILPAAELADGETDEYAAYAGRVRELLGWESGSPVYLRLFDIKIVDAEGRPVEIAAPVDVSIELADREAKRDGEDGTQVIHFDSAASAGDLVENVDVSGGTVRFEAEGFSAYAIVERPEAVPIGWHTVASIEELAELGARGLYVGHPNGFYMMNTLTGDSNRTGITKTKPAQAYPPAAAALYYFEPAGGASNRFYVYCYAADGVTRQYVKNAGNNSLSFTDQADATAFTAAIGSDGTFTMNNGSWYWNMQGGDNGSRFCSYDRAGDANNKLYFWYYTSVGEDPYSLDGRTFGLMSWNGSASGKALMAEASGDNGLAAKVLTVLSRQTDNGDKLFVPNDSDISLWTFHWSADDRYRLSVNAGGSTKYLRISAQGLSLVSEPDADCDIQVIPGTGAHGGEICLRAGNVTLTYSGSADAGFSVGGSAGSEWLHLVELSELTADYFMTFSASKVSVSDPAVTTGSKVIVYTRIWNEAKLKYDFYAIDHDGTLYPCYENGDSIEWVGNRINTLLWQFTEYDYEDGTPNYYYELYNVYSEKFLAPQLTDGQIVSDEPIGINLDGRRNGRYYSTILTWDDLNYAFAGLMAEDGRIASCAKPEASDFYFAIVQPIPVDDSLTAVPTIDHSLYGITMKLVDFNGATIKPGGADTTQQQHNVMGDSSYTQWSPVQGLLSSELDENGYPTATITGRSLAELFGGAQEVNHLFLYSTHQASGYFEFDSTQNYASLQNPNGGGDFVVYREIGTHDAGGNKNTLKHGQFFPYNGLTAGSFASVNRYNLYTATADPLPDGDPRKYEQLYLISQPDYFFGMELEASFLQTPSGLDDWGHDIVYEFTGDDDFWLYVDGELVIDLGGIHGALPGSVNFRTGAVRVNGVQKTLRQVFEENYRARNAGASDDEVAAYLDGFFADGGTVFKDNTTHVMRIFFMERGAGASNLYMRFNLASIRPGTVLLSKELAGVDTSETMLAEFAYQIFYRTDDAPDAPEYPLGNHVDVGGETKDYVIYKDSTLPVDYVPTGFTVDGVPYEHVFLLRPGETAEISFPEGASSYRIVECGVNTGIYRQVSVNGGEIAGTPVAGHEDRSDFDTGYASAADRAKAAFTNTVDPEALRTLTISKRLFQEDGETPIGPDEDDTAFSFRLYFKTEMDTAYTPANMYTYHVKDPDGNYCRWDVGQQRFVSVGSSDYAALSDAEKAAVSFNTSMNGSISKIPADYTVELRQVLAGTWYMVEERDNEIPDGFSLQRYERFEDADDETGTKSLAPAEGLTVPGKDPHVDVRNLKGWGLRVNKNWSDADYMDERDPTYFGLFTGEEGARVLVPGTLRELPFGQDGQSLYWYFDHLPAVGTDGLDDYAILEVAVVDPTVDGDGVVTAYASATPAEETVTLRGRQTGETESSDFEYTVTYTRGEQAEGSNVRTDEVLNSRPGLVLMKQDWSGNALAGASFTLTGPEGEAIGSFVSDEEGLITIAFLRDGEVYTLSEDRAPQGYYGLQSPLSISLSGETVSVGDGADGSWYILSQGTGNTPTLTVRDRPRYLQAVKTDGETGLPLAGVTFALHRQVTVDGVTMFDYNPMPGYEALITDADGVIPLVDGSLPPGSYELREKDVPPGYLPLGSYIEFTVSETGAVVLDDSPDEVSLSCDMSGEDGAVRYTLTVPNAPVKVRFQKVDVNEPDGPGLENAVFDLYRGAGSDRELLLSGLRSRAGDGLLTLDGQTEFALPPGVYTLTETSAPPGYFRKAEPVTVTVGASGLSYDEGTNLSAGGNGLSYDEETGVYTLKISNATGYQLPASGGGGTAPYSLTGAALILTALLLHRRRPKRKGGSAAR